MFRIDFYANLFIAVLSRGAGSTEAAEAAESSREQHCQCENVVACYKR